MNWIIFVSTTLHSTSHWKLAKPFCFTWGQWKALVGYPLCKKQGWMADNDHIHFSSTHTVCAVLNLAPRWFSLTFTASFSAPHKAALLAATAFQLCFSCHSLVWRDPFMSPPAGPSSSPFISLCQSNCTGLFTETLLCNGYSRTQTWHQDSVQ